MLACVRKKSAKVARSRAEFQHPTGVRRLAHVVDKREVSYDGHAATGTPFADDVRCIDLGTGGLVDLEERVVGGQTDAGLKRLR